MQAGEHVPMSQLCMSKKIWNICLHTSPRLPRLFKDKMLRILCMDGVQMVADHIDHRPAK